MGKHDFEGFPEISAFVEPSLAVEGALWFSNLQQADPYLILPFILSATLFIRARYHIGTIGIAFEPKTEDRNKAHVIGRETFDLPNNSLRSQRISEVFALAVGPATLQFPSAMLLYWITHSVCEIITAWVLQNWFPLTNRTAPLPVRLDAPKQQYRGPKMQDLRSRTKIKNK